MKIDFLCKLLRTRFFYKMSQACLCTPQTYIKLSQSRIIRSMLNKPELSKTKKQQSQTTLVRVTREAMTIIKYSGKCRRSYLLWYMQRQGSRAIVSPCVSSSRHITHSPLSSFSTSSKKTKTIEKMRKKFILIMEESF